MTRVLTMVMLIVAALAAPLAAEAQASDWEKHTAAGRKAYEDGRYAQAETSWLAPSKKQRVSGRKIRGWLPVSPIWRRSTRL